MVRNLLGYGASRKDCMVIPEAEQKDAVSIVSIPTDRSDRIKLIDSWKDSRKQKTDGSSADSVLSDVTFSMMPPRPQKGTTSQSLDSSTHSHSSTDDFILECNNGERIYVPSWQGMVIKTRSRHIRLSLDPNTTSNMFWGGSDSDSVSVGPEQGIITKKTWSPRTARHILEMLTDGTTWIDNDQNRFVELLKACDEINARLFLGSPINYHDILDSKSSILFFKLVEDRFYRFQLAGTIKSRQWMQLIQKGILLHLDSKVLMLSATPPGGKSENSVERQKRLAKCDELYSEFVVYSKRSKINVLYTILGLLSSNETRTKTEKSRLRNRSAMAEHLEESIQIVCKTVSGGLSDRDWETLWRMTSASYMLSTPDDESLLQNDDYESYTDHRCTNIPVGHIRICKNATVDSGASTTLTMATSRTEITDRESIEGSSSDMEDDSEDAPIYTADSKPALSVNPDTHETRTINGTSFVALKHMFDTVNRSDKCSSTENRDPSLLPACLSISNPTPDTLGRFINACTAPPSKISHETTTTIGYEILPSSQNGKGGIRFYASNTTQRIKEILGRMADYSGTSDAGDANFRLEQRRRV